MRISFNGLVSDVLIRFMSWYDKSSLPRLVLLGKLSVIKELAISDATSATSFLYRDGATVTFDYF